MKIALIHFRVYETDGVSLEMDKWRIALEKMGHETLYISGSTPKNNDIFIDELDYRSEYNLLIHKNSFIELKDFKSKRELIEYISLYVFQIYHKLKSIIYENNIDLIIPNNISSLGFNLPLGIAIGKLAEDKLVEIIYHHHDFSWERERYSTPLFKEIDDFLKEHFPNENNSRHCVINNIAKSELKKRRGIESETVPNVFDFNQKSWIKDEYNNDLRSQLKISENDIVFLQATRIVERKAIEIGFRIIEEVNNLLPVYIGKTLYNGTVITKETKIHFILAGLNELTTEKYDSLISLFKTSSIKVHNINHMIEHSRRMYKGNKVYSLWDVYTMCDFITYTSILEGWGNQLLEGLFAKKPILVYEYPVFKSDIKQYKFDLVTINSELKRDFATLLYRIPDSLTHEKAIEILDILTSKDRYESITDGNFIKGKENLSYDNLYQILKNIINK